MRLAAVLGMGAWLAAGTPSAALDLAGTWYVLVHYKDSAAGNPEAERWEDRIWVFQREGQKLRWTEYPIVVFEDDTGRFERTGRQYARVLDYWEPDQAQLAQIRAGLDINPRGSESKSLRGSDAEGWRSGAGSGAMSANVLTYTETWSIEDPDGLPVFANDESLGGARAETLEGRTEYRTATVDPQGSELRGSYNRDGTRVGSFRAMRAGEVKEVTGSKTQAEMRQKLSPTWQGPPLADILGPPGGRSRDQVRPALQKGFEESLRAQGLDPQEWQAEVHGLVENVLAQWESGKTGEEIQRMIREGRLTAPQ